ncbi:MAG: tetratricopeptide repeat protein [Candidatus Omnitrophica bacterium]|nr:tetratricopeptide repeat protein [Candidatus Omnitrophota bacterium]
MFFSQVTRHDREGRDFLIPRHFFFIIFFFGVLAYSNSFTASFHFDDQVFIVENPDIRSLIDPAAIWHTVISQPSRFIAFYSFALDYRLYGLNVVGYHVTNFIIHFVNAWLVFFLFCQLGVKGFHYPRREVEALAFITALIFIAHPVQTQAVAYITQRFTSLAAFFYLLAMTAYFQGRFTTVRIKFFWFGCALISAIAAMFTKEIAITLPLSILATELYLIRLEPKPIFQHFRQLWSERKVPFSFIALFSLGLVVLIPAIFRFNFGGLLFTPRLSESHAGDILTFPTYLLTETRVFAHLLRLFFIPIGQNLDYDFPMSRSMAEPAALFSILLLAAMGFGVFLTFKKYRVFSYGLSWMLITFASNFVPREHVIFEHKLYLTLPGLALCVCCVGYQVIKNRRVYLSAGVAFVLILTILTWQRNLVWQNDVTLWTDVIAKAPQKFRAYVNLANAYINAKNFPEAEKAFNAALRLNPAQYKIYFNRGVMYERLQDYDRALADYTTTILLNPQYAKAYASRGLVYKIKGELQNALVDYNKALVIDPKMAKVYSNRGIVFSLFGQKEAALNDYTAAIGLDPLLYEAYCNRAVIYKERGELNRALTELRHALQLKPDQWILYLNIGNVYLDLNQLEAAGEYLTKGLRLDPGNNRLMMSQEILRNKYEKNYQRQPAH